MLSHGGNDILQEGDIVRVVLDEGEIGRAGGCRRGRGEKIMRPQ